ncbi:hypothetical protein KI387_039320 [Taxus chinensis]|uniref:Uncharacterized protein n=1 Tax=Taxus chinensis TaxID=29808 RepID=A0AA38CF92_TAXCH|nr:hypothetical protein KI387_039320 [Taxus chinensis]
MATISSAQGFTLVCFLIGFSLATFVSCQFWMSSMFNTKIVGRGNGVAGEWGNMGAGATQLAMSLVYDLIQKSVGSPPFTTWCISFFLPRMMHLFMGLLVLIFRQDLPDGNYVALHKQVDKAKDKFSKVVWHAVKNLWTLILALTHGYCFGVELIIDNVIAEYFYDKFDLILHIAGIIASTFGLANVVIV